MRRSADATTTIVSQLDVAVSTEDDVEVRRLAITNQGSDTRELDVTSYVELALASPGGRSRASGIRQAVPRNRIRAGELGAALSSPAARAATTRRSGRFTS